MAAPGCAVVVVVVGPVGLGPVLVARAVSASAAAPVVGGAVASAVVGVVAFGGL